MPSDWAQLWGHGRNLQVSSLLYRCVYCTGLCAWICNPIDRWWKNKKSRVVFYVHVSETFPFSICKALHFYAVFFFFFFFRVKSQMGSKWVGKGQASRSAKAENGLLHVAFYLVKLAPNQGQRSVMRWEGGKRKRAGGEDSVSWGEVGDGGVGKEKEMC